MYSPHIARQDKTRKQTTGNGPAMYMFDYFVDFVYYRILLLSPTDAMWHAWNAAQDFNVEDFCGIVRMKRFRTCWGFPNDCG